MKIGGRKLVWANKELWWLAGNYPRRFDVAADADPLTMQNGLSVVTTQHAGYPFLCLQSVMTEHRGVSPHLTITTRGDPPRRSSKDYLSRPTLRATLLLRDTSSTTTQEPLLKV